MVLALVEVHHFHRLSVLSAYKVSQLSAVPGGKGYSACGIWSDMVIRTPPLCVTGHPPPHFLKAVMGGGDTPLYY